MTDKNTPIRRLWKDIGAQDMVEYALAAGMLAVAAVGAFPELSSSLHIAFSRIESVVTAAMGS
jgi:pilus assembly protein Flp/PilA